MEHIRQVLARNMKEYRRRRGFSQVKLAEQADVSSQYIAMIEMGTKFPKPEMLERLALALDIKSHQFFEAPPTPEDALALIRQDIVSEMERLAGNVGRAAAEAVKDAFAEERGAPGAPPSAPHCGTK